MPEDDARVALDMMNYGMYVVGSRGPMGLNMMAAHWLMQISFKPRMVALSLENDARTLANFLGPIPTAGFFCNGEIGPVGAQNFLHGFTASIALVIPEEAG